jgi:hypothetical protein
MTDAKPASNTKAPAHQPTDATRLQVEKLSGLGITREDIALLLGTSRSQLQRLYKTELARGSVQAKTSILRSAFNQAVGAPAEYDQQGRLVRAEVKPVPIMTIFLAKSRAGLRETTSHEVTGKGGKPIETKVVLKVAPDDLEV